MDIVLIVSISLLVMGIVFIIAAVLIHSSYEINTNNSSVITGELLCFRKLVLEFDILTRNRCNASSYDEDYMENAPGLLPVVRFYAEGKEIIGTTQVPNPRLNSNDIGKMLSLRCTKSNHVIVNDEDALAENKKMQARVTLVLSIIGVFFLSLSIVTFVVVGNLIKHIGGL